MEVSTIATMYGDPAEPNATTGLEVVVIAGIDEGRAVGLPSRGTITVGTAKSCDLVLTDERVSAEHLRVEAQPAQLRVLDSGSTNGTLYRGVRVHDAVVPPGAILKLGRTTIRIGPRPQPLDLPPARRRRFGDLVAHSLAMRQVFAVLERAATSDVTVLLQGETGTGKELAARAIHDTSERRRGPFVAVDCGALPPDLVDSELFGHVRGAFTGATGDRKGAFARAAGGTLFLDELDTVPPAVQARLLRALEERTVRPVGSDSERPIDLRLVAASQASLPSLVADGSFRADLFYRIAVLHVRLPPLRDRREDIGPIVAALLEQRGLSGTSVAGAPLERLLAHDWPGNVRELRNVVDRAIALSPGAERFAELTMWLHGRPNEPPPLTVHSDRPFTEAKAAVVEAFEREYLCNLWAACEGNVSEAARRAQLDRKHLRTLLRRHGLLPKRS